MNTPPPTYKGINHQNFLIYLLYIEIANGEVSVLVKALLLHVYIQSTLVSFLSATDYTVNNVAGYF